MLQAGRLAEKPNRLLLESVVCAGATGRAGLPHSTMLPGPPPSKQPHHPAKLGIQNGTRAGCPQNIGAEAAEYRTMKGNTETNYANKLSQEHDRLKWLVRHVAATISRYSKRDDGTIPQRRITGKSFNNEIVPSGECVW